MRSRRPVRVARTGPSSRYPSRSRLSVVLTRLDHLVILVLDLERASAVELIGGEPGASRELDSVLAHGVGLRVRARVGQRYRVS